MNHINEGDDLHWLVSKEVCMSSVVIKIWNARKLKHLYNNTLLNTRFTRNSERLLRIYVQVNINYHVLWL